MADYYERYEENADDFFCEKCQVPLEKGKVMLHYMGNDFPIEMPRCPVCGNRYIPESLAMGKILQVEKALEDK